MKKKMLVAPTRGGGVERAGTRETRRGRIGESDREKRSERTSSGTEGTIGERAWEI